MKTKASFSAPLFALILYALLFASGFVKDRLIGAGGNVFLSVIILQILIFILPAIIFCRMKGVGYAVKLNIKLFSPGKLGCVIMSALVLICGSVLIRFAQIYLFGMREFSFSLFDTYLDAGISGEFLFTATAFAVVPALTEEFVYRTILLTEYNEAGFGAVTATLVTSLLSSMMCFSLETLPIRFMAAVMFCVVTYVTGSSIGAFLSHIIFNIYGIFGEKYILKAIVDPSNKIISIFTFTLLFLILAVILLGEFEHILRRAGQSGTPTPSYRLKKAEDGKTPDVAATEAAEGSASSAAVSESTRLGIEAYFSPTFLLCILAFVVAIFGFTR
jgi:membrane protease YdiL (CAAX protease family)